MAAAEGIDRGYLGSLPRLTLLAPDLVETILDAKRTEAVALPRLLTPFTLEWATQRNAFGSG
jgi:hypothetical protein